MHTTTTTTTTTPRQSPLTSEAPASRENEAVGAKNRATCEGRLRIVNVIMYYEMAEEFSGQQI